MNGIEFINILQNEVFKLLVILPLVQTKLKFGP